MRAPDTSFDSELVDAYELGLKMASDDNTFQMNVAAFYQDLARRKTIREFSDKPVPREVIEQCLLAAGTAPSGANHQPWHFAVISDPALKAKVRLEAEIEERDFYERLGRWFLADPLPSFLGRHRAASTASRCWCSCPRT